MSLGEIESLFAHNFAVHPDLKHSGGEERYFAIGPTPQGRWLFVAFTLREVAGETLIRP